MQLFKLGFLYVFIMGLLYQAKSMQAAPQSKTVSLFTPLRDKNSEPFCDATTRSVCSLGDYYANQDPSVDWSVHKHIDNIRHIAREETAVKQKEFIYQIEKIKGTLLNNLSPDILQKWENYFRVIIESAEFARLRNNDLGYCGEAASLSIIESIQKQITTHTRETIQEVGINGWVYDGMSLQNVWHYFVIYNSNPISPGDIQNQLGELLQNLVPHHSEHPILVCDSWIQYQGEPQEWEKQFKRNAISPYPHTAWSKIEVNDISIPSFNELNEEQRQFFESKILEIVSLPSSQSGNNLRLK